MKKKTKRLTLKSLAERVEALEERGQLVARIRAEYLSRMERDQRKADQEVEQANRKIGWWRLW